MRSSTQTGGLRTSLLAALFVGCAAQQPEQPGRRRIENDIAPIDLPAQLLGRTEHDALPGRAGHEHPQAGSRVPLIDQLEQLNQLAAREQSKEEAAFQAAAAEVGKSLRFFAPLLVTSTSSSSRTPPRSPR